MASWAGEPLAPMGPRWRRDPSPSPGAVGPPAAPAARPTDAAKTFALTILILTVLVGFLSPIVRSAIVSLKTTDQLSELDAPLLPSVPRTFAYQGEELDIYLVPSTARSTSWRSSRRAASSRRSSTPRTPDAPIVWAGLVADAVAGVVARPGLENYADVWNLIDYPRLLFNTIALALIGMVGTLVSCTLVAYGFARFRFPGRSLLFTLLIATIFLPSAVTIVPTYTMFVKLGWVGTWLPLLVPAFFANAYDVFLLRQYLLTIPREMDEAAAIDGAGPLKTLISVILPQAWPVIIAVAIFHLVYAWNDFFGPLIYLSTKPDLQPLAVGLQRFNGIHYRNPALRAGRHAHDDGHPDHPVPVVPALFTRGIVVTGVEK